jgi:hypothetical protein
MIDRIFIATTPQDLRLCRICIASVRQFHPQVPIQLLAGAPLPPTFLREVQDHYQVGVLPLPSGHYGWGFVKLEPLFLPAGQTFLILDADTALTGPVLNDLNARLSAPDAPQFIVDQETQPESDIRRLYYDWEKVASVDPSAQPPRFVFNSGQWVGQSGVLTRSDFEPWVDWTFPRKLRHPALFMPGDQGILNYLINQKQAATALRAKTHPLMHWPGHGMEGFSATAVANGSAPARVVHWAGLKRLRLSQMPGADLLAFFERRYYAPLPMGWLLRRIRAAQHWLGGVYRQYTTWLSLFLKKRILRSET